MTTPDSSPTSPKTWLIANGHTPLGLGICATALSAGHFIGLGLPPTLRPQTQADIGHLQTIYPRTLAVLSLDTASPASCTSAIPFLHDSLPADSPPLSVLLFPPSPLTPLAPLEHTPAHSITACFDSTFFGPLNLIRAALPHLRKERFGHLVVITGITAAMGHPGLAVRCAGDHALEGLMDGLAYEVAPFGIRVSCVQPPLETAVGFGVEVEGREKEGYELLRRTEEGMMAQNAGTEVRQTVEAVMMIAGRESPPVRVVVAEEDRDEIRKRLGVISEELEELLEVSLSTDF